MLYVSTRSKTDSFTAYRAMHNDTTPDGGAFLPFQQLHFSAEKLTAMGEMSFGDVVAKMLNTFYSCDLSGLDVDFCIGKYPIKIENSGHKTVVAELWHNHGNSFSHTVDALYRRICGNGKTSEWAEIAIDISILFGVFSQLKDIVSLDLAISESQTALLSAAWFCKIAGLPINRILIACTDSSPMWEFVRTGSLNTAQLKRHDADLCRFVERFLFLTYGIKQTTIYLDKLASSRNYTVSEELLDPIAAGLGAVVLGQGRAEYVANSVLRASSYKISNDAALAFAAVQDYRAQGGESKMTLLLSTKKPE